MLRGVHVDPFLSKKMHLDFLMKFYKNEYIGLNKDHDKRYLLCLLLNVYFEIFFRKTSKY